MHEVLDALEDINLDYYEYAMLLKDTAQDAATFKMYIPKIMPAVQYQEAFTWSEQINPNIFVNDVGCKIKHAKKVQCQNFLSIKNKSYNEPKIKMLGSNSVLIGDVNVTVSASNSSISISANKQKVTLKKGTKCIVRSMYGNVKDLYVEKVL